MSFICPHCSYENLDPSTFCVYCGQKLPTSGANEQIVPSAPYGAGTPSSPPPIQKPDEDQDKMSSTDKRAAYPASPTPSNIPHWGGMPTPPPMSNTPGGTPNWGPVPTPHVLPPQDLSTVPPGQQWASPSPPYPAPPMQHPGQQLAAPPPAPSASFSQMGTTALATLRRALAGYGTVITHHSWLLEGKQTPGETLASSVKEQLKQQHYIGATPKVEQLHEDITVHAEREFLLLQRGSATEFIYVASADEALYISRATTIQPPLSYIRVGVATILLLVVLLGPIILGGISGTGAAAFFAIGFSLLYSSALFLLFSLLLLSIASWLQEKDVVKYLRTNLLSDFQIDDVAMLELATDRAIRDVIQQAGIDPHQITPPARGYQPGRKIRFI